MSPFAGGYASYYRVGDAEEYDTSNEIIVDTNGNECYRTTNTDGAKSWGHIIGYANDFFLRYSMTSGMERIEYILSLIQVDGSNVDSCSFGDVNAVGQYDNCSYHGEGWYKFINLYYCVNFDRKIVASLLNKYGEYNVGTYLYGSFQDGIILTHNPSWKLPAIVDTNLEVKEYAWPSYSNDLNHYDVVGENILYASGTWSAISYIINPMIM